MALDPKDRQSVNVLAGTVDLVSQLAAGTVSTLLEGTVSVVESGTLGLVGKVQSGTIDLVKQVDLVKAGTLGLVQKLAAGTVNTFEEGTVSVVESGTLGLVGKVQGGTVDHIVGGTIDLVAQLDVQVQAGTIDLLEAGTLDLVKELAAGTVNLIDQLGAGTLSALLEGTVSVVESGTLGLIAEGTVNFVESGTVNLIDQLGAGTVSLLEAGTVDLMKAGTVSTLLEGTVSVIESGTVSTLLEGTVSVMESGTLDLVNKLTNDPDFLAAVNAGQVPGYSLYHQWGRSNALNTTKRVIWDGGDAEYYYSISALPDPYDREEGYRLTCNDDNATQNIVVETLDNTWGTALGTYALTGQTPVNIGTNIRAYGMRCIGPFRDIVPGTVYLSGSGAITAGVPLATMVRAMILTPNNQSLMCTFPVPAGRTAYVVSYWASINKASGVAAAAVDVELWVGGTGMPFQIKSARSVNTIGGNPLDVKVEGEPVIQKSDIELRGICSAACDVSAGFDILMKDN